MSATEEIARAPAEVPPEERLSLGVIWAYALPRIGFGLMGLVFSLYLMKFATDVLLIAPAVMGMVFFVARLWDAVSDPMAGYLSDRTVAARGRRRYWMFYAAVPLGIGMVMMWSPPPILAGVALVAWVLVAMLIYETATTAFFVPYGALAVELTSNYHERTRLFGYVHVIGAIGSVVGLLGFEFLRRAENQRLAAFELSIVSGVVVACLIFYAVARLPERAEFQGRGGVNLFRAFWDVFRNPHSRLLLIVYAIEAFGLATLTMLAIYVMQYIVKAPEMTAPLMIVVFVAQVALTPLWLRLSRRFGKKRLWMFSMCLSSAGYTGLFFVGEGDLALLALTAGTLGIAGGCGAVVAPSIQADVIDYDEYMTGERKEGAYLAVWNFVRKAASAVTAMLTGFALQFVGFEPNAEQADQTKLVISALFGLAPGSCMLIGAILFSRFSLNEREHGELVAALRERREREAAVGS